MTTDTDPPRRPETLAAQALDRIDPVTGAVIPPLHPATTYARDNGALIGDTDYRRPQGPVDRHAADVICALEGGADAQLFASGLAAAAAVFDTVAPGGHVIAQTHMYYGAGKLLARLAETGRITLSLFDPNDPRGLSNALNASAAELVWIETPANPVWAIVDIAAAAEQAHAAGAILALDASAAPPCTTRALDHGADLVMHSATKYLNGHSDVMAGVVITNARDQRWEGLRAQHSLSGAVPGALESWLLVRGLRTLFVRFARQSETALAIAEALVGHTALSALLYPGLSHHPGHAIAARQMTGGFGGLLSLRLKGGFEAAARFAADLKLFAQATSFGGVESLVEHRKPIEGPQSTTPDDLVRLSVGLEAREDLLADLTRALDALV